MTDFIFVKPDMFKDGAKLINTLEELDCWKPSKVRDGDSDPARTNSEVILKPKIAKKPTDKMQIVKHVTMVKDAFINGLREYLEPHKKYCSVSRDEGITVLKYAEGNFYKPHTDGDSGKIHRRISAVLYLNDNFEGGETDFPDLGVEVKPKAGSLLLFPSNFCFVHGSKPVTKGTKYAIVTWFR